MSVDLAVESLFGDPLAELITPDPRLLLLVLSSENPANHLNYTVDP
jgi:hypothetical protein